MKITDDFRREIEEASHRLEGASPQEVVRWAWETLGERAVLSSSFGSDAAALLHMVSRHAPEMRVAFIDTGWHFEETLEFRDTIAGKLGLNLVNIKAPCTEDLFLRGPDGELQARDPQNCCSPAKTEAWRHFLIHEGVDGWLAGLRRESGGIRSKIRIVEIAGVPDDTGRPVEFLKIHPMANWTKREVWSYILEQGVPYHPLADKGYTSIGCWPCTRPVGAGEGERAGRWSGSEKTECGLHTMTHPMPVIED